MSSNTRRMVIQFLMTRQGGGWKVDDLVYRTDAEVMDFAAERHIDVDQDVLDLRSAGLWPMPAWMVKRGIAMHGREAMCDIVQRSDYAKTTTYA